MKFHVKANHTVIFYVHIEGCNRPAPTMATVLRVSRGCLTIADDTSSNGTGTIVCHQGNDGTYWYENGRKSLDIVKLADENGNPIKVPSFIED